MVASSLVVADGRQHAPRSLRPAAARGAHQRTGGRRARASACPAPRSTPSPCRPASPRSAACCWRSARTSSSTAPSSPTSRRSSSWRGRSSAASASCSGPIFGATLAPGSLGGQLTNAIFDSVTQYIQLIGGVLRRAARAAEPGRHRQGVDQPVRVDRPARSGPRSPSSRSASPRRSSCRPRSASRSRRGTLEVQRPARPLRRRRRRQRRVVHGQPGPHRRADRPERRRQDVGDRRRHRLHPRRPAARSRLDGRELLGLSATKRARAGLSRSFQSLELFEDATVLDNLRAASDPRDRLVVPPRPRPPGRRRRCPARSSPRSASSTSRTTCCARCRTCPTASAGCSPSPAPSPRSRACCCSTSRRPASATSRRPSWPTSCAAWPTTGASPSCSSSTT